MLMSHKEIYASLIDKESRDIFEHKLLFALTDDSAHIETMLTKLGNITNPDRLKNILNHSGGAEKQGVVLFGAGQSGVKKFDFLQRCGVRVKCFCDNSVKKQDSLLMGVPVISPEKFFLECRRDTVIISTVYSKEIYTQLISAGFPAKQIITSLGTQYFEPFLPHKQNEIFVDGGAFDGQSSLDFLKWSRGDFKKIFIFEPDKNNMKRTRQSLSALPEGQVEYINAGLWKCDTQLGFTASQDSNACLSDVGPETVSVVALDTTLGGEELSFLKMDIEGAELEALHGASNLIMWGSRDLI